MKKIRKAIIPAAGFGTRFLPATKAVPKEMLPIVDKPTIQYIVEEAVQSGIEEILIITNCYKSCIENHFDVSFELEKKLEASDDQAHLEMVRKIAEMANVYSVRQKNPRGLGHAVLCAKSFVGDEPFAILLGDDIVVNAQGKTATQQLVDAYYETGGSVVGVQSVQAQDVHKYGIIDPAQQLSDRLSRVKGFVEKPSIEHAPSRYAILGRYVLTPDIFTKRRRRAKATRFSGPMRLIASANRNRCMRTISSDAVMTSVIKKAFYRHRWTLPWHARICATR